MAAYFLDTSGLVKRHVDEAGSTWVRALTQPRAGNTIFLARITAVKVVSAITRRQRGGSLSISQASAILGHFRRHLAQRYHVLELTSSLLSDAGLLARKHGLRAYDAVQLAAMREVAELYRSAGLGRVILISADRELNVAAEDEGLAVDNPNSHH
ncbi:type II toxin-antitoxin system VapC family toxin [Tundrisphaera sp. TA3]|uniref:type II toxin-antitoxin system VapC family toxin n=1 Tax=Tundrisphaera sp. TA3 TaxID=3435775 RepID=UPI003EB7286E